MRRADHLDLKLGSLQKIEKSAGDDENFLALLCRNAVSGQIEKSDTMRRFAQFGQEIETVSGTTVKPAQIKLWKQRRGVRHSRTLHSLTPVGNLTGARIPPHSYAGFCHEVTAANGQKVPLEHLRGLLPAEH